MELACIYVQRTIFVLILQPIREKLSLIYEHFLCFHSIMGYRNTFRTSCNQFVTGTT